MAEQDAAKIAAKVTEAQKQDPKTTEGLTVKDDVRTGQGLTGGREIRNVRDEDGNITGVEVIYYNRDDLGGPEAKHVAVK